MKFINDGEPIKMRSGNLDSYSWGTLRKEEIMDLPEHVGENNNLTKIKTTESSVGNTKIETKQIESNFYKELCSINGIGNKTAEDIVSIFPKSEDLKNKLKITEKLPFRDDISDKLIKEYGE